MMAKRWSPLKGKEAIFVDNSDERIYIYDVCGIINMDVFGGWTKRWKTENSRYQMMSESYRVGRLVYTWQRQRIEWARKHDKREREREREEMMGEMKDRGKVIISFLDRFPSCSMEERRKKVRDQLLPKHRLHINRGPLFIFFFSSPKRNNTRLISLIFELGGVSEWNLIGINIQIHWTGPEKEKESKSSIYLSLRIWLDAEEVFE